MAMKKESRREHNPVKTGSAEASQLASQLAPPEEQAAARHSGANGGGIVVDTSSLKLPRGFIDEEKDASRFFQPHPVVIVIFILALAFIAFITYLISIEPPR